jgi:MFS family permease
MERVDLSRADTMRDDEIKSPQMRKVIFGSSLGTAFEWYDFFVFGTLAVILGPLFFSKSLGDTGGFLAGLATYGAGLVLRPFGSLVFGKLGDVAGRKKTFMITMVLMGISTAGVGLLPTYQTAGVISPILLVLVRCVQGLALGGEYGGAATYVAEHAAANRRGFATGWIQICATMGFFLSLIVVLGCQSALGPEQFKAWGWRLPFLASVVLFAVSMYIRAQLNESPVFLKMKAAGKLTRSPIKESFGQWSNMKVVLLALFGAVSGSGIIWYTGQFYALIFLQKSLKMNFDTAYILMAIALALATPFFVICGWLSDHIGRKKMLMATMLIASVSYMPLFKALTHYGNPALERAIKTSPVRVLSSDCKVHAFSGASNDCERVQEFLNSESVPHTLLPAAADSSVRTEIGSTVIQGYNVPALTKALRDAKYPEHADPAEVNKPMVVLLLFIVVLFVCMGYGPVAAYLVELFPTRVRYTSISLPYHVGTGYFGGFMLYFATLITTSTGNIYAGLWYPIVIAVMSFVIGTLMLPETKDWDVNR